MSSGVAYTLQILGQKELNPAIASLIMCLESVFSALGGWLILHQRLSVREALRLRPDLRGGGAGPAAGGGVAEMPGRKPEGPRPPRAASTTRPPAGGVKQLNIRVRLDGTVAVSIPLGQSWADADRLVLDRREGGYEAAQAGRLTARQPSGRSNCPKRRMRWPISRP